MRVKKEREREREYLKKIVECSVKTIIELVNSMIHYRLYIALYSQKNR